MKKLLFCVLATLLTVNVLADEFSAEAEQQKSHLWDKLVNPDPLHITPAYSNAVYQAILPRLSETISQLKLAETQPVTAEQVKGISIHKASPAVYATLTDGACLYMNPFGLIYLYYSPSSLFYESPFGERFYRDDESVYTEDVSAFMGQTRMNQEEIIDMARQLKDRLCAIGFKDDLFSIEGEPQVEGPFDVKRGHVPYAKVSWGKDIFGEWSNDDGICLCGDYHGPAENYFEVEINTDKKQIVSFLVKPTLENFAKHFQKDLPRELVLDISEKVETETEYTQRILGKRYPIIGQNIHVTETYSNAVLKIMLPRVTELAKKLELPIELPITEDQVEEFKINQYGYIGGGLILKNSWQFAIDTTRMGRHYSLCVFSPNHFFAKEDSWENLNRYYGTNKMTETEIIEYSKDIAGRLGLAELMKGRKRPNEMEGPIKPRGKIKKEIPHTFIQWKATGGEPYYFLTLEFNTETKEVEQVNLSLSEPLFEYDLIMGHTEDKDLYPETEAAYQARIKKEKEAASR